MVAGAAAIYLAFFGANAGAYLWRPLPPVLNLSAMQKVLNRPEYANKRYLTLGIGGNNVSALSIYHPATTVDGNYNFARRLPELNQAPIALLDEAKYYGEEAIAALAKILLNPGKYRLKVLFLRDQYYTPLLEASGWQRVNRLPEGIDVWETPYEIPEVDPVPARQVDIYQMIWSVMPLSTFALGLWVIFLLPKKRGQHRA